MVLKCKDGTFELDEQIYEESRLVQDLVDRTPGWIASHTMQEVYDEIEELYYK